MLRYAATIKATSAVFSTLVATVAVWQNLRPPVIALSELLLPILFGICVAAFIGADYCGTLSLGGTSRSQVLTIRRASRLLYIWLYVLFGANALAACMSHESIETASERLGGGFLIAGIVILILIRLVALTSVPRSAGAQATAVKSRELQASEKIPTETGSGTLAPAEGM